MRRYLELFFVTPSGSPCPSSWRWQPVWGTRSAGAPDVHVDCDGLLRCPHTKYINARVGVAPGAVTPSAEKMATLQEFLHTQSFLDAVARRVPLQPYLANHSQLQDELAADALGKTVTVAAPGPQILTVSAKSASPTMAARTVQSTIDEFTSELGIVLKARGQSVATAYQEQLNSTSTALTNAQNALTSYLLTHVVSVTDPRRPSCRPRSRWRSRSTPTPWTSTTKHSSESPVR